MTSLHTTLGVTLLIALSTRASADWIDEMPDVATVATVVQGQYGHGPTDQSTVAVNLAAALILLRQLMEYREAEDHQLAAKQRDLIRTLTGRYLAAEYAIGRAPSARQGAPTAEQAHQFYESRRYEKCAISTCWDYWMRSQLEFWGAATFRERLLPLLFPCGDAPPYSRSRVATSCIRRWCRIHPRYRPA